MNQQNVQRTAQSISGTASRRHSRVISAAALVTFALAGAGALAAVPAGAAPGAADQVQPALTTTTSTPEVETKKIAYCHRTHSSTNPYVFLDTSLQAFYNSGHIDHLGPVFPQAGPGGFWGDIVPPNKYAPEGMNWTAAGQAIFNNGCQLPTEPPAPTQTPTDPPTETPTETPAPTPTETPSETPTPTETPSEPAPETPPTPSETPTTAPGTGTQSPTVTPSNTPAPATTPATDELVYTGANDSSLLAAGGAALLLGGVALWRNRRTQGAR